MGLKPAAIRRFSLFTLRLHAGAADCQGQKRDGADKIESGEYMFHGFPVFFSFAGWSGQLLIDGSTCFLLAVGPFRTKEGEDVRRFSPLRLQLDHLINFPAALIPNFFDPRLKSVPALLFPVQAILKSRNKPSP